MIYFVQETGSGRVKIGFSQKPSHRVSKIASDAPHPIVYWGAIEGTREDEAALHAKYSAQRAHGEWFHPDPALVEECRALCSGHVEVKYPRSSDSAWRGVVRPKRVEDCRTIWQLLELVGRQKLAEALGFKRSPFSRWTYGQYGAGFDPAWWPALIKAVPGLTEAVLKNIAEGEREQRAQWDSQRAQLVAERTAA